MGKPSAISAPRKRASAHQEGFQDAARLKDETEQEEEIRRLAEGVIKLATRTSMVGSALACMLARCEPESRRRLCAVLGREGTLRMGGARRPEGLVPIRNERGTPTTGFGRSCFGNMGVFV